MVLFKFLQLVVCFSSEISYRNLAVLAHLLYCLGEFFSSLFRNLRNHKSHAFTVVGWVDSDICNIDCLLDFRDGLRVKRGNH